MSGISNNRITNANVYLEGESILGHVEELNVPEIKFIKSEQKTLGMFGKAEFTSGIDKMEMKIKWNSIYADSLKKIANPFNALSYQIRGSIQNWESASVTGEQQCTVYMRAQTANFPGIGLKQQDNVEMESLFSVYYYKLEVADVAVIEIDVLANIFKVDGVDLLAAYKANTGT